jgi:YD repeat-containing protein
MGSSTYAYDANSNMTARGAQTLTYDAENRLTQVTASGITTQYLYNADSACVKRAMSGTTVFFAAPRMTVCPQTELHL